MTRLKSFFSMRDMTDSALVTLLEIFLVLCGGLENLHVLLEGSFHHPINGSDLDAHRATLLVWDHRAGYRSLPSTDVNLQAKCFECMKKISQQYSELTGLGLTFDWTTFKSDGPYHKPGEHVISHIFVFYAHVLQVALWLFRIRKLKPFNIRKIPTLQTLHSWLPVEQMQKGFAMTFTEALDSNPPQKLKTLALGARTGNPFQSLSSLSDTLSRASRPVSGSGLGVLARRLTPKSCLTPHFQPQESKWQFRHVPATKMSRSDPTHMSPTRIGTS